MIAIAVDDESWALEDLVLRLQEQELISNVYDFSSSEGAINWANENYFDIAFLDINMRGIGGLELARELREINHKCYIIFCTGYGEYMPEAFGLHANGYVMKPVLPQTIRKELDYIDSLTREEVLLKVRCFGGFDVFDKAGNRLHFKRSRAKELLALLIDKGGMSLTAKEICTYMWEDDGYEDKKNLEILYKLFAELNRALEDAGAIAVLKRNGNSHYVDMDLIDVEESGTGEYMSGYTWSRWSPNYNKRRKK